MNQVRNYSNKDRIAVVTGSSKGIGKAIDMEFAKAGYSVVINARNEKELKQAAEDICQRWRKSCFYTRGYISGAFLYIFDRRRRETLWKN
jgi:NADP-dependent 3-hydroxy acid dehydrogenase YdfG